MRNKCIPLAIAVIAFHGALCAPISAQTSRVHDGRLRVGKSQEPGTLNPILATMQTESDAFALLFDGLVRFDDRGRIIPDLATQVPTKQNGGISPDGKVITYHIDPRAKWQDGAALTSEDVKFTYEAIMNPRTASPARTGYDRVTRVETPDAHTVRITLKSAFAPATADLFANGLQGSILPAHLLRSYADLNRVEFATHPIGSGPYRLAAWDHGSTLVFQANHDYFRGSPKIERIAWEIIPDDQTMLNKLRARELDLAVNLYPYAYQLLGSIPGMKATIMSATYHWEHLIFNCRKGPTSDRRVRRALVYAMDPKIIYEKIYRAYGTRGPTDQNPLSPWFNRNLSYYPHNVAKAQTLLDEAGWRRGADGIRVKDGQRLTLTFVSTAGNRTREMVGVLLQNEWREAGIDLQLKFFPASTFFARAFNGGILDTGNFDTALFAWVNDNPDPDDTDTLGPGRTPPKGNNDTFYQNLEVGRLQERALGSYDDGLRKRLYDRIQETIMADVPEYTLNWMPEIDIAAKELHGLRPAPVGSVFWNAAQWSI